MPLPTRTSGRSAYSRTLMLKLTPFPSNGKFGPKSRAGEPSGGFVAW
jgi:hypothetical protein